MGSNTSGDESPGNEARRAMLEQTADLHNRQKGRA